MIETSHKIICYPLPNIELLESFFFHKVTMATFSIPPPPPHTHKITLTSFDNQSLPFRGCMIRPDQSQNHGEANLVFKFIKKFFVIDGRPLRSVHYMVISFIFFGFSCSNWFERILFTARQERLWTHQEMSGWKQYEIRLHFDMEATGWDT